MLVSALALIGLQTAARPNVIVILADDLGYGEVGVYGQTKIRTPYLDKLAREGARFTQFYSASPVCAPTRCSLLTGKHQGHAAIRGNKEVGGWELNQGEGQAPLPDSEITLAERLKPLGYKTGVFGKWGLGGPMSEGHPLNQGFDEFFGYLCQRQAHNYYPTHLWKNRDVFILDQNRYFNAHQRQPDGVVNDDQYRGKQYSADLIETQALSFVSKADGPFFLYFAPTLPHAAIQAPQDLVDQYPATWDTEPYRGQASYLPNSRPRATYAAMITLLDRSIGRLVEQLKRTGQDKHTLILFTSDNGPAPNAGVDRNFFNSTGGLRGMKTQMWEGGIRVPTIAWWPGRIQGGRVLKTPGYTPDITPTVLEAIGAKPSRFDGVSLWRQLSSEQAPLIRPHLYWEFREWPSQSVLLDGRYKAIRPKLRQKDLTVELYDLLLDPSEAKDLAPARPELVRRAESLFKSERRPNPEFPLPGIDVQ